MKKHLKNQVIELREQGLTYNEIRLALKTYIPNGTLSFWCKQVVLPPGYKAKIIKLNRENYNHARKIAVETNYHIREQYLANLYDINSHLDTIICNKDTAKIALAMLYLGEGSKTSGSLVFCNANPLVIQLYLKLLRYCYKLDETKFRCKVQCRADQDTKYLENYWKKITSIPMQQFKKTQKDPRTVGKPTKNLNYKGVCRISYYSAQLFIELQQIVEITYLGLTNYIDNST